MKQIESVDVVVRVTESGIGEQRTFVLRRAALGFPGDPNDWAAETVAALRTLHDNDVYRVFATYDADRGKDD